MEASRRRLEIRETNASKFVLLIERRLKPVQKSNGSFVFETSWFEGKPFAGCDSMWVDVVVGAWAFADFEDKPFRDFVADVGTERVGYWEETSIDEDEQNPSAFGAVLSVDALKDRI